jgi:hypothetical protein
MLIYTLNARIKNGFFWDDKTYIATPDWNGAQKAKSYLKARGINATLKVHSLKEQSDEI